ncbi:hypothetical protein IAR55_000683 [Kwoniella newhampshirensis]|uniref:Uncharacterized protein n=1 Tax=Kwoniella newhampshirensis TaxID=1651941 RepID=A0AAW0Z7E6_9TREE
MTSGITTTWSRHRVSCHDTPIRSILTYGFLVDGVLDGQVLKTSFEKLVERWPILGSRAAKDDDDNLIWLTPTRFSPCVPHFTFSHRTSPDHFVPSQPTRTPSTHLPSPEMKEIFNPPAELHHPSIEGYIESSQPIFHLQITSSEKKKKKKTAIGLTVPHCFCDAGGMKSILSAWSEVMREGGVEGVGDVEEDTLFLEKIGMKDERVKGEGTLPKSMWIHDIPDEPIQTQAGPLPAPRGGNRGEGRWVIVPNVWLRELKRRCMNEIGDQGWVSEGDVLYAWWAKMVYSEKSQSDSTSDRSLVLTIPMDLRPRLLELSARPYLHNAVAPTVLVYPSHSAFRSQSVANIAKQIREAINSHTEDEIRQTLRIKTELAITSRDKKKMATHFPPDADRMTVSNWLKMRWPSKGQAPSETWLDFSPALRQGSEGAGEVLWSNIGFLPGIGARPAGMACSKDEDGVWMWFSMAVWRWDMVDRELQSLN